MEMPVERTTFDVDVDSVADVKQKVEISQGAGLYPASQQMLINRGKVLGDNTTLEENEVSENSFVVKMSTKRKSSSGKGFTASSSPATKAPKTVAPPTASVDNFVDEACPHPGSFGNMCIWCGKSLPEESGVNFGYIQRGLRLANDEVEWLRTEDMKNLLRLKKLNLILDLDHTLLHSTELTLLTQEEEYLKTQVDSLQGMDEA